jgi:hypothetical protein
VKRPSAIDATSAAEAKRGSPSLGEPWRQARLAALAHLLHLARVIGGLGPLLINPTQESRHARSG